MRPSEVRRRLRAAGAVLAGLLAATVPAGAAPAVASVTPASVPLGRAAAIAIEVRDWEPGTQIFLSPGGPYIAETWPLEGTYHDVALRGPAALLAGDGGLTVIGLGAAAPLAHLPLGLAATRIASDGAHAYLSGPDGLVVVDLQDPARPVLLGRYRSELPVTELALAPGRAFLLEGTERLTTLDVTGSGAPRVVASERLPYAVRALAAGHGRLYLAAGDEGLIVQGIDSAAAPFRYRATGPVVDVAAAGERVFLACGKAGVTVLEWADERLVWRGSHQEVGEVERIEAGEDHIALRSAANDLLYLDVADPALPAVVATLSAPGPVAGFRSRGANLYAVTPGALLRADFAPPPPPLSNVGLDAGQGVNYGGQRRLVLRDGLAYVADWFSGIHVYDVRTPARPRLLASLHTPGSPKGIALDGDYAYVADDDHGLQVVDIRDPRRPALIANLKTAGLAYTPYIDGRLLYLASHRGGFQIVDIRDPRRPRLIGDYPTPGKAWSIQVRNGYAYVAADDHGLLIYDVRRPEEARLVGGFDPGGGAEDIWIEGSTAYVAFFTQGVYILDVSDPAAARPLRHIPTPGNARGLELAGRYLYVADWLAGVQVVDVRDATRSAIVGGYDTVGAAWGVRVAGDRAYIADWWGGLTVLDVSSPDRPVLAARYHGRDAIAQIEFAGEYAFAAAGAGGVQVYDIKNPLNPTWAGGVELDEARALACDGARLYALDGARGLVAIDVSDPFAPRVTARSALPHDADTLIIEGHRLFAAGRSQGVTVFDLAPDTAPTRDTTLPLRLDDLAVAGDTLYAALEDRGVAAYRPGANGAWREIGHDPGGGRTTLLRAAPGRLYAYREERGIDILATGTSGFVRSATIPLRGVRDLRVEGALLYAATSAGAVYALDVAEPTAWRVRSRYEVPPATSRLVVHGGVIYLAGSTRIVALQTLPEVRITAAGERFEALVPPAVPAGAYDLTILAPPGEMLEWPRATAVRRAVTVAPPRFGKPALTMEQFEELLRRHRAGSPR